MSTWHNPEMIVSYPFRYGATSLEKHKAILHERNVCSPYPSKDFSDAFHTGNRVQRLDVQADPVVFHRRRGLYPEDVILEVEPERIGESVQEEPGSDGLLGPALRVPGAVRSRAPVFATPDGNAPLASRQEQSFLLHPFANQGAIRGIYRVFMDYIKPDA